MRFGAFGAKIQIDRICEVLTTMPSRDAVEADYDPAKEYIWLAAYIADSPLARVT